MSDKDKESTDDLLNELESIKTLLNENNGTGEANSGKAGSGTEAKPAPASGEVDIPTLLPVNESPDLADVVLSSKEIGSDDHNDSMRRAIAELESLELGKGSSKKPPEKKPASRPQAAADNIPTISPESTGTAADNIPTISAQQTAGDEQKPAPTNPALKRKIKEIPLHELIQPDDLVEAIIREYLPRMEAELRKELKLIMKDIQKNSDN